MSAPLAKSQLLPLVPKAASFAAVPRRREQGVLSRLVRFVADYPRRIATIAELSRLSDRELADIGLDRSQIRTLFAR